jgi:hypothetical protein
MDQLKEHQEAQEEENLCPNCGETDITIADSDGLEGIWEVECGAVCPKCSYVMIEEVACGHSVDLQEFIEWSIPEEDAPKHRTILRKETDPYINYTTVYLPPPYELYESKDNQRYISDSTQWYFECQKCKAINHVYCD